MALVDFPEAGMFRRVFLALLLATTAAAPAVAAERRDARVRFDLDLGFVHVTLKQGRTLVYEAAPAQRPKPSSLPSDLKQRIESGSLPRRLELAPVVEAGHGGIPPLRLALDAAVFPKAIQLSLGAFNFELTIVLRK
jgi:hypothetical protein